jgi:hypothetical protein
MSPFRSLKNDISSSSSSVRAVEGRDTLGASIGKNTAFETWTYGKYKYYSFTGSGFFEVLRSGPIDVAIIGGGGAGGGDESGGGGGAGAFVENYDVTFSIGRYDVIIGYGASRSRVSNTNTKSGGFSKIIGPSNFTDITALGGGRGSGSNGPSEPGGSGGGASPHGLWSHSNDSSYGSPGGGCRPGGGGGGGGAGSPGSHYDPNNAYLVPPVATQSTSPSDVGLVGGSGKSMFGGDLGIPENYGYNTPNVPYAANGRHFAGGGGGGSGSIQYDGHILVPGGGGAVEGPISDRSVGAANRNIYDGDPNTGGGGAGGSESSLSGAGGSGILIIRIPIVFAE